MFVGTAWNNGSHQPSGAGYGIKLMPRDRDKYFRRPEVFLNLEGRTGDIPVNTDKQSFWNDTCRELISKEIGLWLIDNGKGPVGEGPSAETATGACRQVDVQSHHREGTAVMTKILLDGHVRGLGHVIPKRGMDRGNRVK